MSQIPPAAIPQPTSPSPPPVEHPKPPSPVSSPPVMSGSTSTQSAVDLDETVIIGTLPYYVDELNTNQSLRPPPSEG